VQVKKTQGNDLPVVLSEKITIAKIDKRSLNGLINEYLPFIKKCTSGVFFMGQAQRDNLTEAMLGFIQSVKTYNEERGAFIPYAQMVIRGRLINTAKKEAAIQRPLFSITRLSQNDEKDIQWEYENAERQYTDLEARKEAKMEIAEINHSFAQWGFTWPDLLKSCPKQARSRKTCQEIARKLLEDKLLLMEMLNTGKLPIKRLSDIGYSEKVLEKYRRYICALVLIVKGDYPYIRSFLPQFFDKEGIT
jgi:RNA polymerase sigma factor